MLTRDQIEACRRIGRDESARSTTIGLTDLNALCDAAVDSLDARERVRALETALEAAHAARDEARNERDAAQREAHDLRIRSSSLSASPPVAVRTEATTRGLLDSDDAKAFARIVAVAPLRDREVGELVAIMRRAQARHDEVRTRVALLERGLRPFAEAGALFLPVCKSDRSSLLDVPNREPIGDRLAWRTPPLTIGDLRRAASAVAAPPVCPTCKSARVLGGTWGDGAKDTYPCTDCGIAKDRLAGK